MKYVGLWSAFSDKTDDKSYDGHDGENEEQDLCNFNCTSSNAAKAEKGSNKCDDQKNYGIVQHERFLG